MKTSPLSVDFKYRPALAWTCLGFPDDFFKSLVRQDGSLQYGFDRVITFGLRHAPAPPICEQHTESPESAVVRTLLDYGFARLHLTTFAARDPKGKRFDAVLWRLESTPAARGETLIGALTVTLDEAGLSAQKARLPQASSDLPLTPPPAAQNALGTLLRSIPSPLSVCEDYEHVGRAVFTTESEPVSDGVSLEGAFLVALEAGAQLPQTLAECERALEDTRAFWKSFISQKLALRVPDEGVNDMREACARNILQAREFKDGLPGFQVGPLVYRGLWMVDGFFINEAARILGWEKDADLAWELILKYRQDDGSINIMPFHTKETGIALATLARMTELGGDWERLRACWPVVRKAVANIRSLREEAARLPESDLCHNLLPESYADGGLGGKRRPEYTTILWTLTGMKFIARAARRIDPKDADDFQAMYEKMLADFTAHAERHRVAEDGRLDLYMSILPGQHNYTAFPDEKTGKPKPWTAVGPGVATWAFCQAIYPGEIFPPHSDFIANLLALYDALDNDEDIPKETGWLPWKAQWNYHASFAAHVALYGGKPEKAVQYLYGMANHAFPTRVWREEQSLRSHPQVRYVGDMPHNWASAEFVRLVRNLLVLETADTLHILKGVPAAWRVPGQSLEVEKTPTRFGKISLRADFEDEATMRVTLAVAPFPDTPPPTVLLYIPEGVKNVSLNGTPLPITAETPVKIPFTSLIPSA